MQDLFLIAVVVAVIIGGVIGVAYFRDKKRTWLLKEIDNIEPVIDDAGTEFSAVFERELEQQTIHTDQVEIDDDPILELSDLAVSEPGPEFELAVAQADLAKDTPKSNQASPKTEIQAPHAHHGTPKTWDMVIAFTIMARDGKQFSGKAIKAVFESLDLHFGELQIFHRYMPGSRTQTLFSVANILEPGTLNPEHFATMRTPGLLIFSRLPGPINGLAIFDDLLETARKIADKLDGVLSDESRQAISQTSIEAMRQRILELNMQLQAEQPRYDHDDPL